MRKNTRRSFINLVVAEGRGRHAEKRHKIGKIINLIHLNGDRTSGVVMKREENIR